MLMKTADDGDDVAGVLDGIGILGRLSLDFIGTVGNSDCV
jgi:hypothetical protein